MLNKKAISFLVVSSLVILPLGIARAGDIDVQTDGVRVIVDKNNGISVQSQPTIVVPNYRVHSPIYPRPNLPIRNSQNWYNTWLKKTARCNGSNYSRQSTQTSGSGRSVSQTYSSTSTTVCK